MLGNRRRRLPNIDPASGERLVFAARIHLSFTSLVWFMTSSFKQVCFVTTRNKNQLFVNVVWASELLKQLMANTMPSVVKGTRWFPRNSHADFQDSLVCMFLQFLARRLTFNIKKRWAITIKVPMFGVAVVGAAVGIGVNISLWA